MNKLGYYIKPFLYLLLGAVCGAVVGILAIVVIFAFTMDAQLEIPDWLGGLRVLLTFVLAVLGAYKGLGIGIEQVTANKPEGSTPDPLTYTLANERRKEENAENYLPGGKD
jgi:hypothetical protein